MVINDSFCHIVSFGRFFFSVLFYEFFIIKLFQIFCWSVSFHKNLEKEIPFLISVKQKTFEEIYALLKMVQEKDNEKLMLSLLKLLKLQVRLGFIFRRFCF